MDTPDFEGIFRKAEETYADLLRRIGKNNYSEASEWCVNQIISNRPPPCSVEQLRSGYAFIIDCFKGRLRKDGNTPLVAHSMVLPVLLSQLGENDRRAFLTALYHDVIEDTQTTKKELTAQIKSHKIDGFTSEAVGFLTENALLSGDGLPDRLPNRVKAFIRQLQLAPDYVITVEIIDRFHDIADLAYLEPINTVDKLAELRRKVAKCKNVVHHITEGRSGGFKGLAKLLLEWRISDLERTHGFTVHVVL